MGTKKRLSILAVAVVSIFFLTGISPLFAQQNETDLELWAYILRQGKRAYEQYLGTHGEVNPGDWGIPIEAAFLKLAGSSGEKGVDLYYAITADDNFNAMCFPGGDFVIHSGALKILDSMIESQLGQPLSKIDPVRLQVTRETLLAPVIAHELGHYFNRHAFHSFNRMWSMAAQNRQDIDLTMIQYTQYQEFEADNTGYLLLKRAKYDPDSMLFILELLNDIHQDALKQAPSNAFNVYLSTHPSPHARLATFQRGQQKLHKWAASLEQAFSDIQLGRNLSSALSAIENSFYTVPGNLYLLKAKAVALHKLWLETVTLKDQKLRAIIDLPAFRDDMVFSKLGSRAVRKQIPGDRKLWLQAKRAYEDSSTDAVDPGYYSNFAVLLAYSPEPKEEDLAGQLAGTAAITDASIANLSNLAFVFYHTGQKEKALQLFAEIATEYNKSYTSFLQAAASDPVVVGSLQAFRQQMKLIQQLNSEYVHSEFTPILNFALCLYYEEKKNLSVQVAKDYLDRYESSSLWADYLSKTTGVEIPELPAKSYMAVNGLKVGQTLKDVLQLWGKADETTGYDDGHELWYYDKLKASVYIQGGMVDVIELTSPESPKIEDRIGVGSSQQEIEQEYGKHKRTADKLLIYEGKQNLAVLYTRSIAAGIVLFR